MTSLATILADVQAVRSAADAVPVETLFREYLAYYLVNTISGGGGGGGGISQAQTQQAIEDALAAAVAAGSGAITSETIRVTTATDDPSLALKADDTEVTYRRNGAAGPIQIGTRLSAFNPVSSTWTTFYLRPDGTLETDSVDRVRLYEDTNGTTRESEASPFSALTRSTVAPLAHTYSMPNRLTNTVFRPELIHYQNGSTAHFIGLVVDAVPPVSGATLNFVYRAPANSNIFLGKAELGSLPTIAVPSGSSVYLVRSSSSVTYTPVTLAANQGAVGIVTIQYE